jgi:hypothetical protein
MKCKILVHPFRSGNRTSFGNGGLKNGSFGEGVAIGDVTLWVGLSCEEKSESTTDGAELGEDTDA